MDPTHPAGLKFRNWFMTSGLQSVRLLRACCRLHGGHAALGERIMPLRGAGAGGARRGARRAGRDRASRSSRARTIAALCAKDGGLTRAAPRQEDGGSSPSASRSARSFRRPDSRLFLIRVARPRNGGPRGLEIRNSADCGEEVDPVRRETQLDHRAAPAQVLAADAQRLEGRAECGQPSAHALGVLLAGIDPDIQILSAPRHPVHRHRVGAHHQEPRPRCGQRGQRIAPVVVAHVRRSTRPGIAARG